MTSTVVMQTSRQHQHPLLRLECEDVLNKGGENWLIPLLATIDKKFPLLDIIEQLEPDEVDTEGSMFAASRNPAIEVDKIIHFAMGVFWKASVHSSKRRKQRAANRAGTLSRTSPYLFAWRDAISSDDFGRRRIAAGKGPYQL